MSSFEVSAVTCGDSQVPDSREGDLASLGSGLDYAVMRSSLEEVVLK